VARDVLAILPTWPQRAVALPGLEFGDIGDAQLDHLVDGLAVAHGQALLLALLDDVIALADARLHHASDLAGLSDG
jgi:hypothetical protein